MSYLEKYNKIKANLLKHGVESQNIQNNMEDIINELNKLKDLIKNSINLLNTSVRTSINREQIMNEIKINKLLNIIEGIKEFLNDILSDKYDNYTRIPSIQIFLDSLNKDSKLEQYFDLIDQIK